MVDRFALFLLIVCQDVSIRGQEWSCGRCPDGWTYFRDSCYLFAEDERVDWTEASHYCFTHHRSELVVIETAAENSFLKDMCRRLIATEWFWTGASDSAVEGIWEWYPENIPLNYTDWYPGEPNTFHGHNEDCMVLYGPTNYQWHDGPCSSNNHPLCELRLESEEGSIIVGK